MCHSNRTFVLHDVVMNDAHITEPFLIRLKAAIDADPGLTPAGLSKRAGLADSAIRLMFKRGNQSPSIQTAERICNAMGTTLVEFMSNASTPAEREIVRLVSQLPDHLRQKLLGYGQALLESEGSPQQADPSIPKSATDHKS